MYIASKLAKENGFYSSIIFSYSRKCIEVKEKRLMQYLKIAKEKDIELSDIMKNIICEEGWMSS